MQGNFYTTELVVKARIADSLQEAEHTRMVHIAAEGAGEPQGPQWSSRDSVADGLSRVKLPRLTRLLAW